MFSGGIERDRGMKWVNQSNVSSICLDELTPITGIVSINKTLKYWYFILIE